MLVEKVFVEVLLREVHPFIKDGICHFLIQYFYFHRNKSNIPFVD